MGNSRITVDTFIVGAGLLGSATAMHLAKLGHAGVAVADVDLQGKLSSSELNAGGARTSWDQPLNTELAHDSINYMKQNPEHSSFNSCGYLWMFTEDKWSSAQARAKHLQSLGQNVDILSVDNLQHKTPFVDKADDLAGATFSPDDGLFNPNLFKMHLRKEAQKAGAQFLDGHRVLKVEINSDDEFEIDCEIVLPSDDENVKNFLEDGKSNPSIQYEVKRYRAKKMVNCAGAWAKRLAKIIGYETKSFPVRRQVSIFQSRDVNMQDYGMIVDSSGVYFHPEANNILAGFADPEEPKGYNLDYDGEEFFQEKIWMALYNRSSKFENLKHLTGWGGLYEMSPDCNAVIGAVPGKKNLFENHSFSGRGAMQSYAAGRGLAELIHFDSYQTINLAPLSAERFTTGKLLPEGLHI